jgi:macrolide transport system ATP-binding/permease protein
LKKVQKTSFWISFSRSEREYVFYAAPGELSLGSENRLIYLPQEIDAHRTREILEYASYLPRREPGNMMSVVSGLGTRPERLLESDEPSPGETRKRLLAIGVIPRPHLITMDESTNHLDLSSIEMLEKALDDCPCGLLLVSHDKRFLQATTSKRWSLVPQEEGYMVLWIVA